MRSTTIIESDHSCGNWNDDEIHFGSFCRCEVKRICTPTEGKEVLSDAAVLRCGSFAAPVPGSSLITATPSSADSAASSIVDAFSDAIEIYMAWEH